MRISLRKVVVVLAILTIAMSAASVYAYVSKPEVEVEEGHKTEAGDYIGFHEVNYSHEPHHHLTDPDRYTLEAMNSSTWVHVGRDDPSWYDQPYVTDPKIRYVEYQGKLYFVSIMHVSAGPIISSVPAFAVPGFLALGVCWVGVGYSYHRKNKKTAGHEKS